MSYDLILTTKNGPMMDYEQLRDEVNHYPILSNEDILFGDEYEGLGNYRYHLSEIKYDKEVKELYWSYVEKKKGIHINPLKKVFNLIDKKLAQEFIDEHPLSVGETDILVVHLNLTSEEDYIKKVQLELEDIARKHNLALFNPQTGETL